MSRREVYGVVWIFCLLCVQSFPPPEQIFKELPLRIRYCMDETQPCDYGLRDYSGEELGGSHLSHSTLEARCVCRSHACPTLWDDNSGRSITKDLTIADGSRISIQLRYCLAVSAVMSCGEHDVALTMSGYGPVPMTVEKTYCNCPGDSSAQVQTQWSENYRIFQNYTCARPDCVENDVCMEQVTGFVNGVYKSQTFYQCNCPSSTNCRLQHSRTTDIEEISSISLWKCV